jgi:hypothetical protein
MRTRTRARMGACEPSPNRRPGLLPHSAPTSSHQPQAHQRAGPSTPLDKARPHGSGNAHPWSRSNRGCSRESPAHSALKTHPRTAVGASRHQMEYLALGQSVAHGLNSRGRCISRPDHPDDPTGPFSIHLDRRGVQPEQARSVWTRQIDVDHPAYGSGGWEFESLAACSKPRSAASSRPRVLTAATTIHRSWRQFAGPAVQSQSRRLKSRYRPPDRTTNSTTEATNPECWANPG